jgi:hypothetical protein
MKGNGVLYLQRENMAGLIALLVPAALGATPSSRYAHCAVMFADRMLIYGGRGFRPGSNSLTTLGCANASP